MPWKTSKISNFFQTWYDMYPAIQYCLALVYLSIAGQSVFSKFEISHRFGDIDQSFRFWRSVSFSTYRSVYLYISTSRIYSLHIDWYIWIFKSLAILLPKLFNTYLIILSENSLKLTYSISWNAVNLQRCVSYRWLAKITVDDGLLLFMVIVSYFLECGTII